MSSELPVIACYCVTFLKPEMLHVYRQIIALERVRPTVIAQKRENADRFPFPDLYLVRKSRAHFLRRFWYRQLRDTPGMFPRVKSPGSCASSIGRVRNCFIFISVTSLCTCSPHSRWERPSLVSFHGADVGVDLKKPAYLAATQEMLGAVRRVLVRSESLRRALIEIGCSPEKIELQRTGIPLSEFPFRERKAPGNGEWRLLQACRLIEKKGLKTTLRAFARFKQAFPNAKLVIAGEGPEEKELLELALELDISDAVQFRGFRLSGENCANFSIHRIVSSSQRNCRRRKPGGRAEFDAGGNGHRPSCFRDASWWNSRSGGNGVNGILVAERDHESFESRL